MRIYQIEIIKTENGYMAHDSMSDDYLTDINGNNLFNSWEEAQDLINSAEGGTQ